MNIDFGSEALLGWNVTVIDGDGHTMVHGSEEKSKHEEIKIGNHVWLAAHSSVLKGSQILNNSVVAYGAVVSKKMTEENILIAGQNQIIRTDVDWRK